MSCKWMCWASKNNSIICAKYLSGLFPSGRHLLPEQCSCRARSHHKRDGSRSLPWLWSLKLPVPLSSSSSPQTRLCPWCCVKQWPSPFPLCPSASPLLSVPQLWRLGRDTANSLPISGATLALAWPWGARVGALLETGQTGWGNQAGSPFFSSGCWGGFSVGKTLCQDSQY